MDDAPLVDERVVSRRLGVAITTLRRWRWAGRGPTFIKLGTSVRYDLAELQEYIRRNTHQSTSEFAGDR